MSGDEKTLGKRKSWDDRYAGGAFSALAPHPLLVGLAGRLPPGKALDLACGTGRHAIYLAARGFAVTGLDDSRVGLEIARAKAAAERLEIDFARADLEDERLRLAENAYDLVCDFFFLHRPLFARIKRAVAPGGYVVAAIHLEGGREGGFLLRRGELRGFFADFAIEHYLETDAGGESGRPTAEPVARRTR